MRDRRPGRINPSLELVRSVLSRLGEPHLAFDSTLVIGTNGKGSTAAMLAGVLTASGARVGLYTSPHLVRVEERIAIDGQRVSTDALERWLRPLDPYPRLSFFEALTLAAVLGFAERGVDTVVLEAGMGGRWDATRLAEPSIVGLTNVGTDHTRYLGRDRLQIAREKGVPLQTAPTAVWGPQVDADIIDELSVDHAVHAGDVVSLVEIGAGTARIAWPADSYDVPIPLDGAHQSANLHLAIALAALALNHPPSSEAVRRGLASVRWPGRLSRHRIGGRDILLDGAHNVEAAAALAEHLVRREPTPHHLVFSCLEDKPVAAMAEVLRPAVASVTVCALDDPRAMPLAELERAFPGAATTRTPAEAIARAPGPVVAAGSLRLAGALLEYAEREGA